VSRTDPTWTVVDLLNWAASDFEAKGLPESRRSAEVLLGHALTLDRVGLYLHHDRPVTAEERDRFRELVVKRRDGSPVAYLTGEREFYSLSFKVDSRVLIPRPETELLVDEVVGAARVRGTRELRICDVGTGSGAIAVALKKTLPDAHVVAVDVSPQALDVARENASRHGAEVEFREGDLLTGIAGTFDFVVANLPYVSDAEMGVLPVEVRDFEPHLALAAGEDGLRCIRTLAEQAHPHLPGGELFLEIGAGQATMVRALLGRSGYETVSIRSDLAGIPRVVRARTR